jgi:phage tail-like protein
MAKYPLPKFHFKVEWGGANIGFTEVTGLELSNEPLEYRDGASPEYFTTAQPGIQKLSPITMKRGVFKGDGDFFAWWNTVALNTVERRDVTISLLNEKHDPVIVWKVKNAFPSKVSSTDLNSTGNEVAIETIELKHEGFTVQHEV